ncbi:MAG: alpha/beta hydrolase [Verrucomicrobiota bacterium]|nr:alpha/beta hydrolase [Verrucomicrobiota bacterium]
MSIRLIISLSFILSASLTKGAQSYPPKISSDSVHTYKSVEGHDLKIWVFNPTITSKTNAPAMLFFFGGGWNSGSPTQFVKYCELLSERGMVGIVADYRVKSRQGVQAKTCVEDALDALRYITKNATSLGIDPIRIGVGGGSAGGHLAASLGTIHASNPSAPKVMALFNPATILAPISDDLSDAPLVELEKMNARYQAKEEHLRTRIGLEPVELSPFHHVASNSPPAIIFHGTNDKTVPYESAKLFASQLRKNGVFVDLKTYEGAGHGFFNREPYFSQSAKELEAFLLGLGWLE